MLSCGSFSNAHNGGHDQFVLRAAAREPGFSSASSAGKVSTEIALHNDGAARTARVAAGDPDATSVDGSARWLEIVRVDARGNRQRNQRPRQLLRLQLKNVPEGAKAIQVLVAGVWKSLPTQAGAKLGGEPSLNFEMPAMLALGLAPRQDLVVRVVLHGGQHILESKIPAQKGSRPMQWGWGESAFNM